MKKMINFLLALAASAMLLASPVGASAQEADSSDAPYIYYPIVISVTDEGWCLLSNDYMIYQSSFHHYCGDDYDLQIGDVIRVNRGSGEIKEPSVFPGRYTINEDGYIEYLGCAEEYYADYIKELTVTGMTKTGQPIWTDAEGTVYQAVYGIDQLEGWAECEAFRVGDFSVGDTANCVTGYMQQAGYASYSNRAVILEKTYEAEYTPGDVTGEGDVNLMDVISINRHIMIGEHLTPAAKKAADLNGDGKVTPAESLQILRYVVKLEDLLQ